jgi:hypothetical protein
VPIMDRKIEVRWTRIDVFSLLRERPNYKYPMLKKKMFTCVLI